MIHTFLMMTFKERTYEKITQLLKVMNKYKYFLGKHKVGSIYVEYCRNRRMLTIIAEL